MYFIEKVFYLQKLNKVQFWAVTEPKNVKINRSWGYYFWKF